LALATAFEAPRAGLRAGLVTVDHRLQEGSGERADGVVRWAREQGLEPAVAVPVDATPHGEGPEAAARDARYAALVEAARAADARAVLLGHTRDDQAETVLLALARGGGPRGIAGMPARRVTGGVEFVRPLLGVDRAQTRAACAAQRVTPWEDPHNADPRYARSRVRAALGELTGLLGAGLVANLARTAALVAADLTALDSIAAEVAVAASDGTGLRCAVLATQPAAVRSRVLRSFALSAGARAAALSAAHIDALDALVMVWHGQGPTALPGGVRIVRLGGRLQVAAPPSDT
jgi:tRNA(Ile)-lysidine synthase